MQRQLNLKVKRTVYICDIDQLVRCEGIAARRHADIFCAVADGLPMCQVTEEELAEVFDDCGPVQDCRVRSF